jgi:hypothetical protein
VKLVDKFTMTLLAAGCVAVVALPGWLLFESFRIEAEVDQQIEEMRAIAARTELVRICRDGTRIVRRDGRLFAQGWNDKLFAAEIKLEDTCAS